MKEQLEVLVKEMDMSGILYAEAVREFKKRFILQVMKRYKGNQCKAARAMGMHRNTLSRTIAELELEAELVKLHLLRAGPVVTTHRRQGGEAYPVKSVGTAGSSQKPKAMAAHA